MGKVKTAYCVEQYRDPDTTHITLELDPPAVFQDAETQRFRIIETDRGTDRQFIADNGAWLRVSSLGELLPLDQYLLRYYGYREPLVSKLRRLRGRWDDLDQSPEHAPVELQRLWQSFDALQRLLIAIMADHMAEALERAVDDADWWDE